MYAKCDAFLRLEVTSRFWLAHGPGAVEPHTSKLSVWHGDENPVVIGHGNTEAEMWRNAYITVCVKVASQWFDITKPEPDRHIEEFYGPAPLTPKYHADGTLIVDL